MIRLEPPPPAGEVVDLTARERHLVDRWPVATIDELAVELEIGPRAVTNMALRIRAKGIVLPCKRRGPRRATRELAAARALLERLEWAGDFRDPSAPACPCCRGWGNHAKSCELSAFLARTEAR